LIEHSETTYTRQKEGGVLKLMQKILIKKELIRTLSKEALACYIFFKSLAISNYDKIMISCKNIEWFLLGKQSKQTFHEKIRKGMSELIDKDIISIINKISRDELFLDISQLINYSHNTLCYEIYFDEFIKIFRSDDGCNKFNALFYFICILETFNRSKEKGKYQYKIGYMSTEYINKLSGFHKNTASRYLQLLEKEKILYVIHHTQCYKEINELGISEIKYFTNTYSRYKDKALCDLYDKKIRNLNQKEIAYDVNRSRSLIQKYNLFIKGKEYDLVTLEEIYNEILQWNKRRKTEYERALTKGLNPSIPNYKDTKLFKEYKFYKGEE